MKVQNTTNKCNDFLGRTAENPDGVLATVESTVVTLYTTCSKNNKFCILLHGVFLFCTILTVRK
jgi:hypothetical protein